MEFFKALIIFSLLFSFGCKPKEELGDCDDISMKCYRGYPRACNALKVSCKDKEITYTAARCQRAFNELILGKPLSKVRGLYGSKISGCFNEKEIEKYSY